MVILRETMKATQSIATAMTAVVNYWGKKPDTAIEAYGYRNYVENIQILYPSIAPLLSDTRAYLYEHWLEIARNPMLEDETGKYIDALKSFFGQLRTFENEFCRHENEAFEMFSDAWIARKYFVLMLEQQNEHETLFRRFDGFGKEKPNPARPFRGMARTFRNYIPGASDADLENFILYGIPLPGDRFWGGTRQEAVIFGKAFGLTAADMNHSFLFRAKNNGTREINYTQDASRMENPDYAILELIAMYKHCTV